MPPSLRNRCRAGLVAPPFETPRPAAAPEEAVPARAPAYRVPAGLDVAAALGCMAIGLMLATLPHLVTWLQTGSPVWIADFDDFSVYLPLAARAYHHQPTRLDDPVVPEAGRSYFSSLQLAPGIVLARAAGLGPLAINAAWRSLGGASLGLLWYLLLRLFVRRPLYAAGLAALLLADGGVVEGQLLYAHGKHVAAAATLGPDQRLPRFPDLMSQWRVVNPALSWPWFLLFVWLLARAAQRPGRFRAALAGLGFGALFYVYFYLWTTAGLGLLLAMGLDRRRWRHYLAVGVIGLLAGAPALWANLRYRHAFGNDWMLRSDKFLPVGHFAEFLLPRVTVALAVLTLVWVWWRRRDLVFLWSLAAAGLLLLNQQVVTGLQVENFHWKYVTGPSLALLCVLLAAGWVRGRLPVPAPLRAAFWCFLALHLAGGAWLRAVEATRFEEPLRITEAVRLFAAQRSLNASRPLAADAVVAGDAFFVDTATTVEGVRPLSGYAVSLSAAVSNPEWDTRVALNGYLRGLDRTAFVAEQIAWLDETHWGPWRKGRSLAARHDRLARRLAAWDAVAAAPTDALNRFRVRYLALPADARSNHLGAEWVRRETGPTWQVWERK